MCAELPRRERKRGARQAVPRGDTATSIAPVSACLASACVMIPPTTHVNVRFTAIAPMVNASAAPARAAAVGPGRRRAAATARRIGFCGCGDDSSTVDALASAPVAGASAPRGYGQLCVFEAVAGEDSDLLARSTTAISTRHAGSGRPRGPAGVVPARAAVRCRAAASLTVPSSLRGVEQGVLRRARRDTRKDDGGQKGQGLVLHASMSGRLRITTLT
jgi:hypothetical protein